jgi:CheY-like chemotaxis protein
MQAKITRNVAASLQGRSILIVEDEPLLALELATVLEDAGFVAIGPAATPDEALHFIASTELDAALLDGNLKGLPVDDVAAALDEREIPFVFVTGYGRDGLPATFRERPLLAKPYKEEQLIDAAVQMVSASMVRS